jgi:SAM-dependent methyltransferase
MYFDYEGVTYPEHIRKGFHSQYIIPVAKQVCVGEGIDVGANNEEWAFPGAKLCDMVLDAPWNDALNLPVENESQDYVFSSHCLEHIPDYYSALEEWTRVLKKGGVLFLYLPSVSCDYWRPANNRKHCHIFYPKDLTYDLKKLGYGPVFNSGVDLAYSFAIYGFKNG